MIGNVKRWVIRFGIGVSVLAGAVGQLSEAAAEDAKLIPNAFTPDPAECQSEPRSIEEITALFANATPVADIYTAASVEVPIGTRASDVVSTAINDMISEAFACLNAGDFARFFGLLSDKALLKNFWWVGEELANGNISEEFTSPTPLPPELRLTILAVSDVSQLSDGRAGAFVTQIDPTSGNLGKEVLFLIFTYHDGRWMVDEAIDFGPN